ncbi:MAG: hypothetical protein AAGD07_05210 [Planctomycetota bacterium]
MNQRQSSWIALLTAAVLLPHSSCLSADTASIEEGITSRLPAKPIFWARTVNLAELHNVVPELPIFEFARLKELSELRVRIEEEVSGRFRKHLGIDLPALREGASGEMVVAGYATDTGSVSICLFVETESGEAAATFVAKSVRATLHNSVNSNETTEREPRQVNDDLVEVGQVYFGTWQNYAFVCSDEPIAQQLLSRFSETIAQDGLMKDLEFRQAMRRLDDPSQHVIDWYLDPIALGVAFEAPVLAAIAFFDLDAEPAVPFAKRHGLPGIRSIVGRTFIEDQSKDLITRAFVHCPAPRQEALAMFDFPPGDVTFPRSVDESASIAGVMHWNLAAILDHGANFYDDLFDAPGAFEGTLDDLRSALDVDLTGDLFPYLGPRAVIARQHHDPLNAAVTTVSIELKDAEQQQVDIAGKVSALLMEDTGAKQIPLSRSSECFWRVALRAGETSVAFRDAGVAVARGRLWISTHASALFEKLGREPSRSLGEADVATQWRSKLENEFSRNAFAAGLVQLDRDIRSTYTAVQQAGVVGLRGASGIYAWALTLLSTEVGEDPLPPGTLPPFEKVEALLSHLGLLASVSDEGWELYARVYLPAEASP